jgi:hypothetical protein
MDLQPVSDPDTIESHSQLAEKQQLAVEFLVHPSYAALKLEDVAAKLGVSVKTLYNWRQQPAFIEACDTLRKQVFSEYRKVADAALMKKVETGDNAALRLFYELGGDLQAAKAGGQQTNIGKIEFIIGTAPAPVAAKIIDATVEPMTSGLTLGSTEP